MACHEDDIPDVGDYHVYEIAHLSYLVVRTAEDEFKAYHNACLHRGRMLKIKDGKRAREFRCAFHGWAWNLDGSLKEVPCQWDFPTVTEEEYGLPEIQVGRWGGFLFINPDPDAESLEDYLGNLSDQFSILPYQKRYKIAHVAKILRCNWKIAQEAFSEAYHVIATHPTILETIGDANTQYDVFGNYSRAMSPNFTPSPHVNGNAFEALEDGRLYTRLRHALTGHIYEAGDDGLVHVTNGRGEVSKFKEDATWVEGPLTQPDPNMCNWIGGRQLPGAEAVPLPPPPDVPEGKDAQAGGCGARSRGISAGARRSDGPGERRRPARLDLSDGVPQFPSVGIVQSDRLPVPTQWRQPAGMHTRVHVHGAVAQR